MFRINAVSSVPIYQQIAEQIRRLISSGQLQAGDALPSVRDVSIEHAVNPMTISKAYALAESEGLLLRQRGKPMLVAQRKVNRQADRLVELDALLKELAKASEQLDLSVDDVAQYLKKKWSDYLK